ncbi:MAG: class I SAM-dependent methyltransferase [Oscillospiraceae bacterium]|nr:class I SAM-dependent methyltransferase [Oscillospiraceae bacterium]
MRVADKWDDYRLLDCSSGERLERWGDIVLIRPDPQVIWRTPKNHPLWEKAHARYIRSNSGGGQWDIYKNIPYNWLISYNNLKFKIKTMGFKHTGVFPEQAVNWDFTSDLIKNEDREMKALNLFAYTGGATVSALSAGAKVTHVDASKGMVTWAKENAELCNINNNNVRYLVDDCKKFVEREIRRGNRYDIIIMDPPSYGRGPGGEVWKLEDEIYPLAALCAELLSDKPLMFMINSYTTGLSPAVMKYMLQTAVEKKHGGETSADEIGLPVDGTGFALPCGSTAIWVK